MKKDFTKYHSILGFAHIFLLVGVFVIALSGVGFSIYNNSKKVNKNSIPVEETVEEINQQPQADTKNNEYDQSATFITITKTPNSKPTNKPVNTPTSTPTNSTIQNTQSTPTLYQNPTASYTPTTIPTTTPIPTSAVQEYSSGLMTIRITCTQKINLSIIDNGVNTKPNGVWTYIVNTNEENVYLAYTGPDAQNASAGVNGSIYSIRNATQLTLESGKSYSAKFSHGNYTTGNPNSLLTDTIAQITFTPHCN